MTSSREDAQAVSMWWNCAVRETLDFNHRKRFPSQNSKNSKNVTGRAVAPGKQIAAVITGKRSAS